MTPAALHTRLPRFATPFVGRQDEITQLVDILNRDTCHLLTLTGPGGSGKTRLAIEVANQLDFADGVYFVALQPLRSVDNIVTTIVDTLPLQLSGSGDPQQQLQHYLGEKHLLLLMDNFEHLLDGVQIVTDILKVTTRVKLLVTSRERLNLQAEQAWPVWGLSVPDDAFVDMLDQHSAIELFVKRAHRVQPDFSLDRQRSDVVRICQLVKGLPLALELAASWVEPLSCHEIAIRIQENIDILTSPLIDMPERHQSMRAVFNYSWQRLSLDERRVFRRLTVFRDGFTPEAAEFVAETSAATLRILAGKSLLWPEPESRRYSIHELLRQYAEEQLHHSPDEVRRTQERHCTYYTDFLHEHTLAIRGGQQYEAVEEISADLENVGAAWQWAVEQHKFETLDKSAYTLELFHQYRSTYLECAQALQFAVESLDDRAPPQTQAHLLNMLGWILIRLSRFDESRTAFEQSQDIMTQKGLVPRPGRATDPLPGLSLIASIQGDHRTAVRLGRQALEESESRGDQGNMMMSSYVLVSTLFAHGQYQDAQFYAQQTYDLAEKDEDHWFMALSLNDLGKIARVQEHFYIAETHHRNSYNISQAFGDTGGMAGSLIHLGKVELSRHNYSVASVHYQEGLAMYEEIGDPAGLASALIGLGQLACLQAEDSDVQRYFDRALRTAWTSRLIPLTLSVLKSVAEYNLYVHLPMRAIILLSVILNHTSSDQETQHGAGELLQAAKEMLKLSDRNFTDLRQHGRALNLEDVVASLRLNFNYAFEDDRLKSLTKPLLSERELEVLQLIAKGNSNQQIALKLHLGVGTVRSTHVNKILRKLDVKNRTEAVARARELGLIN